MKKITSSHGTGLQMEEAMRAKLNELTGVAESIDSAESLDDTFEDRYIHSLIGDLSSKLTSVGFVGVNYYTEDSMLYIEIPQGEDISTYEIPFEDLSFNFDTIDEDVDYITDSFMHGDNLYTED